MSVLFCHGLESSPHGRKVQSLRAAGLKVIAPDFQGQNLAARVATLLPVLRAHIIVPPHVSEDFAAEFPQVRLELVDDEHALNGSQGRIIALTRELLTATQPAT